MKKQNIESRIVESLNERTPDTLNAIKKSHDFRIPEKTKKSLFDYLSLKRFSYSLATIFILVVLVVLAFSSQASTPVVASTITVDINPSIQITLDEDDMVINVTAINTDGEEIVNKDIEFRGLTLDRTIEIIIRSAYERGFIVESDEENIILISVESKNEEVRGRLEVKLEEKISNEVNKYGPVVRVIKERHSNITNEQIDQLVQTAKNNNISVAKLLLIRKIIALDSTRSLEELKSFSIRQLYRIQCELLNLTDENNSSNDSDDNGNPYNPDNPYDPGNPYNPGNPGNPYNHTN